MLFKFFVQPNTKPISFYFDAAKGTDYQEKAASSSALNLIFNFYKMLLVV